MYASNDFLLSKAMLCWWN